MASATNEKLMARMNNESLEGMSLFTWLQWIKVMKRKDEPKKLKTSINANNNNNGLRYKHVEFTTTKGVLVCQVISLDFE